MHPTLNTEKVPQKLDSNIHPTDHENFTFTSKIIRLFQIDLKTICKPSILSKRNGTTGGKTKKVKA